MSKTAEPLNCHKLAKEDVLLADRVEHRDPRAQNWCIFYRVDVLRDSYHGFRTEENVLCVAAVHGDAVDGFMFAHLKKPTLTGLAGVIMT